MPLQSLHSDNDVSTSIWRSTDKQDCSSWHNFLLIMLASITAVIVVPGPAKCVEERPRYRRTTDLPFYLPNFRFEISSGLKIEDGTRPLAAYDLWKFVCCGHFKFKLIANFTSFSIFRGIFSQRMSNTFSNNALSRAGSWNWKFSHIMTTSARISYHPLILNAAS